jgi:hypothetical protein
MPIGFKLLKSNDQPFEADDGEAANPET